MLFTTNKPLSAWGRVLHDPDLAQAILDRVLEHGRHLELRGPSYRTRHVTLDLTQDPEPSSSAPARISGNRLPEFPEPTPGRSGRPRCRINDIGGDLYVAREWDIELNMPEIGSKHTV